MGGVSFFTVIIILSCAVLLIIRQLRKKKAYTIDREGIQKSKSHELRSVIADTKKTNARADSVDTDSLPPHDTVEIRSNPTYGLASIWKGGSQENITDKLALNTVIKTSSAVNQTINQDGDLPPASNHTPLN